MDRHVGGVAVGTAAPMPWAVGGPRCADTSGSVAMWGTHVGGVAVGAAAPMPWAVGGPRCADTLGSVAFHHESLALSSQDG